MAMGFSEADVISALKKVFVTANPRVLVGIGDDAAVVKGDAQQVITTDMAIAEVHFKTEWSSAFDIGRKITAANIADVLSMGARCDYLVAAVSLTGNEELAWIENLARGMKDEADRAGAAIVGGDWLLCITRNNSCWQRLCQVPRQTAMAWLFILATGKRWRCGHLAICFRRRSCCWGMLFAVR